MRIDPATFKAIQLEQNLSVDYQGFLEEIVRILENMVHDPKNYFAIMNVGRGTTPNIEFVQNLEYKYLQLLNIDCESALDDQIRSNITYRYSTLKAKHTYLRNKLRDITAIIKLKNPSLLLTILKSQTGKNL